MISKDDTMSRVYESLYVGDLYDSMDLAQLAANGISHIVRIGDFPESAKREENIIYKLLKFSDDPDVNIRNYISEVNDFVHAARLNRGVVLIHCAAGISRSVALATSYIMATSDYGLDDSFQTISNPRSIACPNTGFRRRLEEFEKMALQDERNRIRQKFGEQERELRTKDNAVIKSHRNISTITAPSSTQVKHMTASSAGRTMDIGMSRILDTLFVGSEDDAMNVEQLKANKISHIVRIHEFDPTKMRLAVKVPYLPLMFGDHQGVDIREFIPICNDFVHDARLNGGSVLIHCVAGVSRSVTLATTYIMSTTDRGATDVLEFIKRARPQANPKDCFRERLIGFEIVGLEEERERIRSKFGEKERELRAKDNEAIEKRLAVISSISASPTPTVNVKEQDKTTTTNEGQIEGSTTGINRISINLRIGITISPSPK